MNLSYVSLNDTIKKRSLCLDDQGQLSQETIQDELGRGTSKIAFRLSNGRAILLPNWDRNKTEEITNIWSRVVKEEVAMSNLLSSLGLLSPMYREVSIITPQGNFPAYVAETFDSLKTSRNWSVIDLKSQNKWERVKRRVKQEDFFNEAKWDKMIAPILDDIVKICRHNIPYSQDSFSLAVLEKSDDADIPYEVRYFGFDFALKVSSLRIPTIEEPFNPANCIEKPRIILEYVLNSIFEREFYYRGNEVTKKADALQEKLTDKYYQVLKKAIFEK